MITLQRTTADCDDSPPSVCVCGRVDGGRKITNHPLPPSCFVNDNIDV